MDIGELLKNKRLEKGLTQRDVADAVGVSEGTVSRWESGKIGNMRRDRIQALANTLSIDPVVIAKFEAKENTSTAMAAGAAGLALGAGAIAAGAPALSAAATAGAAVAGPLGAALLGIFISTKKMMDMIGVDEKSIQLDSGVVESAPGPVFLTEKDDVDMVTQYLLLSDDDKAVVRGLIASLAQKYKTLSRATVHEGGEES